MKKLSLLLVAAVVLVGLALFLSRRDQMSRRPAGEVGRPLAGLRGSAGGRFDPDDCPGAQQRTATIDWVKRDGRCESIWVYQQTCPPAAACAVPRAGQDRSVLPGARLDAADSTEGAGWTPPARAWAASALGQSRQAPARDDAPWRAGAADGLSPASTGRPCTWSATRCRNSRRIQVLDRHADPLRALDGH